MFQFFKKCFFLTILLTTLGTYAEVVEQDELSWPQIYDTQDAEITVYQPQIEKLDKNDMVFRVALATKKYGSEEVEYGALKGRCKLDTDTEEGVAYCSNIHIDEVNFPGDDKNEESFKNMVNEEIADQTVKFSTEHLLASLKVAEINKQRQKDKFEFKPPKIIVTNKPTALITIDGNPVLRPVSGDLMRVINTPFVILFSQTTGDYYIRTGKTWHMAPDLNGPWIKPPSVPKSVKSLEKSTKSSGEPVKFEDIIVTYEPTEMIQINGLPEYTPIKGTDLLYVYNTESDVFLQVKTQRFYLLLSGRWYTSKDLSSNVKWQYVPPSDLPKTFANIPEESDKGHVLASVPGTTDAEEAIIRNQIPTTAAVDKKGLNIKVQYDGQPQFKQIPQTPLYWAENANKPVIRFGSNYYANEEAVWFVSINPMGPWTVAESIPAEIYDIPPSHPLYYLTYNYIYDTDEDYVYVGYTPGYEGSYAYDGSVIFGTGYYYPGWTGDYYYGYPHTYGYNYVYDPYYGWYPDTYYTDPLWFGIGLTIGLVSSYYWYDDWYPYRYHYYKRDYRKRDRYKHWDQKHVRKRHSEHRKWGDKKYRAKGDDRYRDTKRDRAERNGRRDQLDTRDRTRDKKELDRTRELQKADTRERDRDRAERDRRTRERDAQTERDRQKAEQDRQRVERGQRDRQKVERDRAQREKQAREQRERSERSKRNRRNDIYTDRQGRVYRRSDDGWQRRTPQGWNKKVEQDKIRQLDRQRRSRDRGEELRSRNRSTRSIERSRGQRGFEQSQGRSSRGFERSRGSSSRGFEGSRGSSSRGFGGSRGGSSRGGRGGGRR